MIFEQCGLNATLAVASDPFFGRGGKLMANNQREQGLKFEALAPIASPDLTAVSSFNFHQDHFGSAFGIQLHDGRVANSACLGFGLERITLALFGAHGMETRYWPQEVRAKLWPDGGSASPGK
jgi:seryl-tRNA synthetase